MGLFFENVILAMIETANCPKGHVLGHGAASSSHVWTYSIEQHAYAARHDSEIS
jgi:hypothetical protein